MNKFIFMKRKTTSSPFLYKLHRYTVMKNIMALFTMYLTVPSMKKVEVGVHYSLVTCIRSKFFLNILSYHVILMILQFC